MASLLIYSPEYSTRLQYVLEEIFRYRFQLEYELCHDISFFKAASGAKLNYSPLALSEKEVWIPSSRFLFQSGIKGPLPDVHWEDETPAMFAVESAQKKQWPFDLFALVFFSLSRYEEYLPVKRDEFGRFPASESLAVKEGFQKIPVLDIWIARLREDLQTHFPDLPIPKPKFSFLPTIDVDQAWAFLHKPLWRQLGGALQELFQGRFPRFRHRWSVWTKKEADPFDTFPLLIQAHKELSLNPVFFFLLANPGKFDNNISHTNPALRALIQNIALLVSGGHTSLL